MFNLNSYKTYIQVLLFPFKSDFEQYFKVLYSQNENKTKNNLNLNPVMLHNAEGSFLLSNPK